MSLFAYVNVSGTTLTLSAGTEAGAPIVTAVGALPTVRVNGGAPVAATLAVWCDPAKEETTAPHVAYVLPVTVRPGDAVTVSLAAGAVTTTAGPCEAVTDLACTNYAGTPILPQDPPADRRMKVGYMAGAGAYWDPINFYANWLKGGTPNWSRNEPTRRPEGDFDDATGMPLTAVVGGKTVVGGGLPEELVGGFPLAPSGRYTLLWDGPGDACLFADLRVPAEDLTLRRLTGAADNVRVYPDVPCTPGARSPSLIVQIDMITHGPGSVKNVRLFDKYVVDPFHPPKFHPKTIEKLRGAGHFRFKDAHFVDGACPVCDYEDYPSSEAGICGDQRTYGRVGVVRFEDYFDGPFCRAAVLYDWQTKITLRGIKVTCAAPHGLKAGGCVSFFVPGQEWTSTVTFRMAAGDERTVRLDGVVVYPVSDAEFVFTSWFGTDAIAPTPAPAGTVLVRTSAGMSPEDSADLCDAAGMDAWISVPHGATDDCVTKLFTMLATRLGPGRKVWLEYTNEPWNCGIGYVQFQVLRCLGYEMALARQAAGDPSWLPENGGDPRGLYYCCRFGQLLEVARAAWRAAGRDPADVKGTVNSWFTSPGVTAQYVQYLDRMDTQGRRPTDPGFAGPIPCDAIAIAPYLVTAPYWGTLTDDQYASLTMEQVMDIDDSFLYHSRATGFGVFARGHRDAVAASSRPGLELISYEGGPSVMGLGGSGRSKSMRTICWGFHPRARAQMLAHLAILDECGMSVYTKNGFAGVFGAEGGTHCYQAYYGLEQDAGTGDGSDGKPDARPYLADPATGLAPAQLDLAPGGVPLPSPVGLAIDQWNALAGPPAPTPDTPRRRRRFAPEGRGPRLRGGRDGC